MNLESILLADTPLDPAVRDGILLGRDLLARIGETVRHMIHKLAPAQTQHDLCSRLRQIADGVHSEFGPPSGSSCRTTRRQPRPSSRGAERDVLAGRWRGNCLSTPRSTRDHVGPL